VGNQIKHPPEVYESLLPREAYGKLHGILLAEVVL
tara:strand:- start:1081 stop:1185 length:105 start_codon:yes stop_codon:yes gene_type:complete